LWQELGAKNCETKTWLKLRGKPRPTWLEANGVLIFSLCANPAPPPSLLRSETQQNFGLIHSKAWLKTSEHKSEYKIISRIFKFLKIFWSSTADKNLA
jgi:hypothetical protein